MQKQERNRFLLGILGAILGAFIGTIPSILAYNLGNILVAVLSLIIATTSYYGYKLTKNKIEPKSYAIISISSILAITTATFIIVPAIYLLTKGYKASFGNLSIVYNIPEVRTGLIHDYIISLVFTVLGIGITFIFSNNQIKELDTEENSEASEKKQKEENYKRKKMIIIALIIVFVILTGIGYAIAGRKNKELSNEVAKKDSQNIIEEIDVESNEVEHIIPKTGLKFVPKDNLKILTQKQINEYFGQNVENYEIIAMDDTKTKMLYMLIDNGEDAKGLNTTEYIKATFGEDEEIEITDVTIAEVEFKKARSKA